MFEKKYICKYKIYRSKHDHLQINLFRFSFRFIKQHQIYTLVVRSLCLI